MGARKPDGSSAKTERVTFTRPAAERIAKVVRKVEQGDRGSNGLRFLSRSGGGGASPKTFRVCTFTGSWNKNTDKTLTFKYQTTTPNTVTAKNLLFDIAAPETSGASTTKVCIIGKEATAWYFVNTEKESCESSIKAKELDAGNASDDSDVGGISERQGPQVLLNDNGCVRWVRLAQGYVLGSYSPGVPLIEEDQGGIKWTQIPVWFFASPSEGEEQSVACDKIGAQLTGGSVTIGGGLGSGTVTIDGGCESGKEININISLNTDSCPTE